MLDRPWKLLLYLSRVPSWMCSHSSAVESAKGLEGMLSEPRISAVSKGLVGEVAYTWGAVLRGASSEVLNRRERTCSWLLLLALGALELPALTVQWASLGRSDSSSSLRRSGSTSPLRVHHASLSDECACKVHALKAQKAMC